MTQLFLGIDASKGYADFVLMDAEKDTLDSPFQLDDNTKGHKALLHYLDTHLKNYPIAKICCGIESTGGYENNWFATLDRRNLVEPRIRIARVNPKGVTHTSKSELKRTVNDKVSATSVAAYLCNQGAKILYSDTQRAYGNLNSLQPTYMSILMDTKQVVQHQNQLEKLLYSAFPEFLTLHKGKGSLANWAYLFLQNYPTSKALSQAVGPLKKIPRQPKEKIAKLRKEVCNETIAGQDDPHMRKAIVDLATKILAQEAEINRNKAYLARHIKDDRLDLLTSLPGIANYSACIILMCIGDIERFPDANHMASFFGLPPKYKKSGDGSTKPRMSKQGNSNMRAILYMNAKTAVCKDPHLREIFKRHMDKGWKYNQAIGVIMHKMCRIIYGILKSNKPYDSKIDKAHIDKGESQNKPNTAQRAVPSATTRRLQPIGNDAPTSKRNSNKRKAYLAQIEAKAQTEKQQTNQTESKEVTKTGAVQQAQKVTKNGENKKAIKTKKASEELQISQVDINAESSSKT